MKRLFLLILLLLPAPARAFEADGTIVFLTDFGTADDAVAVCKGVILSAYPEARIVDLTHEVTPYDVREGAIYLGETANHFPKGTVFLGVVDPGVGTARKAVALETRDGLAYVGPDNGLATLLLRDREIAGAWEIREGRFLRPEPDGTFHGRDVFAPVAALIASSAAQPSEAGPPLNPEKLVRLRLPKPTVAPGRVQGEALLLDKHYGNVWTNVSRKDVEDAFGRLPDRIALRVQGKQLSMPLVRTFGDVPRAAALAYFNSRGKLSFALNQGDFAKRYGVEAGNSVVVTASTE